MIGERIAQLAADIKAAGGSPPMNCGEEPKTTVSDLESILADCRARKANAKPGTPALIACLSEKLTTPAAPSAAALKNALQAKTTAAKAAFAAAEAKARAKSAAAALKLAPAATRTPHLDKFNGLKGGEATAYFRQNRRMIQAEQTALNIEAATGQQCTISATGTIRRTSKI